VLNASTKRVIRFLVRYWRDNPFACDSAEGIFRWWLGSAEEVSIVELDEALEHLQRRGLIERHLGRDGRERYRRTQVSAGER
jgi:hypothetical protein